MGNEQSKEGQLQETKYENHKGTLNYIKSWVTWSSYPGPPPFLKKPFLQEYELDKKNQEILLQEFEKLAEETDTMNCLLVGQVNSGKSSFINAIATALSDGKYIERLTTVLKPGGLDKTCTQFIEHIPILRGKSEKPIPLKLFDCRGLHDIAGVQTQDLLYFLDGHIKERYEFNSECPIKRSHEAFRVKPSFEDKMHCVIYVVNAQNPESALASKAAADTFKTLREKIARTHIPQLVLMCKADKLRASFANNEDLEKIFYSQEVREKVRQISRFTCIDECDIMPQVNYEKSGRSVIRDTITLNNLVKIMTRTNHYIKMYKAKEKEQSGTYMPLSQTSLSE